MADVLFLFGWTLVGFGAVTAFSLLIALWLCIMHKFIGKLADWFNLQ